MKRRKKLSKTKKRIKISNKLKRKRTKKRRKNKMKGGAHVKCMSPTCAPPRGNPCPQSHPLSTNRTVDGCCAFWSGPCQTCCALPLSIQMHEFALYTHYTLRRRDPNFIFYVQPKISMGRILDEVYGPQDLPLTREQQYNEEDIDNIHRIALRDLMNSTGTKVSFQDILSVHGGWDVYQSTRTVRSYINARGFRLLYKLDYSKEIHDFYRIVREFFCKVPFDKYDNYVNDLKKEYEDELDGKSWSHYNSMEWSNNFQAPDVFYFLEDMIKKTESRDELKKLAQHYVNLTAEVELGDARSRHGRKQDIVGTYIIVKLKDPDGAFHYGNTEMIVHQCFFDGTTPAQFHWGIMRNPSDYILAKMTKKIPHDKLGVVLELNREDQFF